MPDKKTRSIVRAGTWWGKAAASGILAGMAVACYEMVASSIAGGGFWEPINKVDATFKTIFSPAEGFDLKASTLGLALHMATSAFWGLVLAAILGFLPRLLTGAGASTLIGLGYGLLVGLFMSQGIGPRLDEVLIPASPLHFLLAHLAYGLITAWALYALSRKRELILPKGRFPFPQRLSIRSKPS